MDRCDECGGRDGNHFAFCTSGIGELLNIAEAVLFHQTYCGHPLTCDNDDCKPQILGYPIEKKLFIYGGVLKCHYCDYEQTHIPDVVMKTYREWRISKGL